MNAESWKTAARHAEHEQHFYVQTLQEYFRPGARWLDAGCGHSLLQAWLPKAKELERRFMDEADWIVGADVDTQSLSLPCSIPRVACDLTALAFEDESFDLITCNMVVEHLDAPQSVFREFCRVLRPGGVVVILTPNLRHWANAVARMTPFWFHRWALRMLRDRPPEDVFPTRYLCNTQSVMRRSLRSVGFSDVDVRMVPGRPRLIKFGPLFYPEYFFYRLSLRFPELREVLCAVAQKPCAMLCEPASPLQVTGRNDSRYSTQQL